MNSSVVHSGVAARRDFSQAETLITAIAAREGSADDFQSALLALLDETFVRILGKHDFYLLLARAAYRTGRSDVSVFSTHLAGCRDQFCARSPWSQFPWPNDGNMDFFKRLIQCFLDHLARLIGSQFVSSQLERVQDRHVARG